MAVALPYKELELCDIIMKGGITSGVVYPEATRVLSEKYRFKSIGGTSAGAIAAAAAAAAEYGRRPDAAGTSFDGFSELPTWMGTRNSSKLSNLASLFTPQAKTRKVFETLFAAVGDSMLVTPAQRARRVIRKALVCYWWAALLGALPGLIIAVFAAVALALDWETSAALLLVPAFVLALLLTIAGAMMSCLVALLRDVFSSLPNNYFGLCTGGGGSEEPSDATVLERDPAEPLTYWLADYLDELAGLADDRPLTFGDLWDGDAEPTAGSRPDSVAVRLNMITTDLTSGEPRRLPFEPRLLRDGEVEFPEVLYVRKADLIEFFPRRVVNHMTPNGSERELWTSPKKKETLFRLPAPADLPVVFATRLSLSFPGLLSAFPIYVEAPGDCARLHWFSDGGITSNFPAHFFDAPLPSWPTFAVNLHAWSPDDVRREDECDNVGMWPATMSWAPAINGVAGFAGAIKDAMQNWRDNAQISLPGYRERVAHIGFYRGEGGLNLYMPDDEIRRLAERGSCAGRALRDAFFPRYDGTATGWLKHRWTRHRSTLTVLETWFALLRAADDYAWTENEPGYRSLQERRDLPRPFTGAQATFAENETASLLDMARRWGPDLPNSFQGAEEPEPQLRILPRL
jgi:predicted acylesterase/phospholipase RssA